jgi:hypothetical protein
MDFEKMSRGCGRVRRESAGVMRNWVDLNPVAPTGVDRVTHRAGPSSSVNRLHENTGNRF